MGEKRHPGLPVSLRSNASVSCAFACPACIVAEIHSVKECSVKVSWHTTKECGARLSMFARLCVPCHAHGIVRQYMWCAHLCACMYLQIHAVQACAWMLGHLSWWMPRT